MNKYLIIPRYDDIEESLELAHKYDMGFEFNDFFSPKILLDEKKLEEKINAYKEIKLPDYLTSHGDFFDVNVFSEDEQIAEISVNRIYQSVEIAKDLCAKKVVFHTNMIPEIESDYYKDNWVFRNENVFRKVCEDFPDVLILMENMFDFTPDMLKRLAEKMKDVNNFGVCLDYAHAFLSKTEPTVWVKELAQYIKHVHINDNMKDYDAHLPVGDGLIDWVEFDRMRDEYFPDASILIEVSSIENQKKSIEYLIKNNLMN